MPQLPASSTPTDELASQRKPRTFIVPTGTVTDLAVTLAQASDELLRLIRVVGQVSDRVAEPRVVEWLTPNIMMVSTRLDTLTEIIKAIVEEQGGPPLPPVPPTQLPPAGTPPSPTGAQHG